MAAPRPGVLHYYTPRLTAFEHVGNASHSTAQNLILFIGGLFDGFGTVPYVPAISDALPAEWNLVEVLLSSSYTGWGTSSIQRDANEIADCINHFRKTRNGKIVLMGHSTGCQDVMEYLTGSHRNSPPIDGGILQAPVSDREAILMQGDVRKYEEICDLAEKFIDGNKGWDVLPLTMTKDFYACPIAASRWLSVASPNHDGEEDYFSSDLSDEQLEKSFGALPIRTSLCIIISGEDEHMPHSIDKESLLARWMQFANRNTRKVVEKYSGIVEGATHNLENVPAKVVNDLIDRVVGYVQDLGHTENPS